jgi:hypothetical protein
VLLGSPILRCVLVLAALGNTVLKRVDSLAPVNEVLLGVLLHSVGSFGQSSVAVALR